MDARGKHLSLHQAQSNFLMSVQWLFEKVNLDKDRCAALPSAVEAGRDTFQCAAAGPAGPGALGVVFYVA